SPDCSFTCHYRCRALVRLDCSGPPGTGDENDGTEQALEKDTNVVGPGLSWAASAVPRRAVPFRAVPSHAEPGRATGGSGRAASGAGEITAGSGTAPRRPRPASAPRAGRGREGNRHPHGGSIPSSSSVPCGSGAPVVAVSLWGCPPVTVAAVAVYLRKLADEEQPLRLRLLAGPSEKVLSFVLKENETGEVNWDAFTLPELHNFLRILQREEEEHVRQLRHRYARCRQKMQEAL
ncbi:RASF1 protein, partial [Columbina picui]|nr:RASF1 protein [Columbina picui]